MVWLGVLVAGVAFLVVVAVLGSRRRGNLGREDAANRVESFQAETRIRQRGTPPV